MKSILRALGLAGILALGAAAAQAQPRVFVGVGFRAPVVVAAVPPCPGVGYVWSAGYYDGPVFVPGRWIYRGYDTRVIVRDIRPAYHYPVRFRR
jgi:hypothetical protein